MKNAFITAIVAIGLTSLFSFTGAGRIISSSGDKYVACSNAVIDTIPAKKRDTSKWKAKKTPYDSFGKPKTMDSVQIK